MGLAYDLATAELTYHLVLSEVLVNETKALGAGIDLGGLADLEFNTNATVGATVTLDTILGVDLDNILGDPRDWFFLRNASATATATIEASDIEASARFGFLSIGVDEGSLTDDDGSGPAEVSLTVQLLDPDNNLPGRVDLREILDNLGNLGDLIDVSGAGSLKLMLPVEFQTPLPGVGLANIEDGNPDLFDLPARSLVVTIPDLSDKDTFDVQLGPGLTSIDLGKFANIDAAGVVGVLGQLTYWLDQFRHSDAFANLDLPLVGPALDEALQLADGFRDLVLLDDNDTELDNSKTLLADLNDALDDAGLGRKLFAAKVGGSIALIALDAGITSFTVAGATKLGFSEPQSGSKPSGKLFAEAVAGIAFPDLTGKLNVDDGGTVEVETSLSFDITIGSKTYAVELTQSAVDNNEKIGDDRWKLINGDNAPTFATAQQMALRLIDAFGGSYPGLTYDPGTDSLNFTLDLTQVFANLNLPFAFDVANLPEFLQLQTSGALALRVSGGLNLEVGIFLGNAESSDKLQLITPLVDLSEPIVLNDNQRYSAQPVIGKLTGDAHFDVRTTAAWRCRQFDATTTNTTVGELVTDINDALALIPGWSAVCRRAGARRGRPTCAAAEKFRGLTIATARSERNCRRSGPTSAWRRAMQVQIPSAA
jgi:hypothetical protein